MLTAGLATATMRALARPVPENLAAEIDPEDDLERSLAFLDVDVAPATVVQASYCGGAIVGLLVLPLALLAPVHVRPLAIALAVVGAVGASYAVRRAPIVLAAFERSRALGAAPDLVGRAVLRMRVAPSPEAAVAFAAESGDGSLAATLRVHVRRVRGRPGSGIDAFAAEWRDWFPALARSCHLLQAAGSASPARRERALERSLSAVLEGTQERLQSFVSRMGGPVTGLYAFGVLLPLALVAVVPGARAAGVPVTLPVLVVVYDVLLPLGLVVAGGWLLVQRPVAFPAPALDRSHPSIPDRRWPAPLAGCIAAVAGAAAAFALVGDWAVPIAALGFGAGVALAVWYRPVVEQRERIRSIEEGLPDACYHLGRRIDDGYAVERAIEDAAEDVPGPIGDVLADAARRCRVLGVAPRAALLGERGALRTVPSDRVRSTAELLAVASREGQPAGQAIVAMAGHLEELQSVERQSRHELARLTGTLRNTAAVFGPLVAGATVALADGMAAFGTDTDAVDAVATGSLGLAVGLYVLLLAAVLATIATGVDHGLDRPLTGYRVGVALASATAVFLASFVGAGLLL